MGAVLYQAPVRLYLPPEHWRCAGLAARVTTPLFALRSTKRFGATLVLSAGAPQAAESDLARIVAAGSLGLRGSKELNGSAESTAATLPAFAPLDRGPAGAAKPAADRGLESQLRAGW